MYIIADDIPIEGEVVCGDPEAEPPPGEIVTYVDCDIDGNGEDDLDLLSGGNRSWLNMDGDSGNADELMEWIEDGYYESISIHTWFGGTEGAVNKIYQDIDTYLLNAKVIVPVFDQICDVLPSDEDDNPCKDLWHEEDQVVPSNTYKDYFHVISFALFKITCVDYGGQSNCPLHEHVAEDLPPQGQQFFSVEGCFLDNFDPGLGGGGGEVDTGPFIVYLKH